MAVSLVVIGTPSPAPGRGRRGHERHRRDPLGVRASGPKLVEAADFEDALEILENLNRSEPGNADVLNMLGYAHRKLGRVEAAFDHYREALAIEPRHLGANEYLGELYLETGDLEMAQERLAELATACPSGCEERDELSEAIAAYRKAHGL